MSEKLCLKWHDFQENVSTTFGNLREDKEFTDVTLACEDGQQVKAHKVILASSSPFFQNLLTKNKHPHPLIYLKGAKFEDLLAIVDFLYFGEANVFHENLDAFLSTAEELKLKGLTGQKDVSGESFEADQTKMSAQPTVKKEKLNINLGQKNYALKKDIDNSELSQEMTLSVKNFVCQDLQELDIQVKSMMEMSQNLVPSRKEKARICKVCGKEGAGYTIRDHIEANHLEGVVLPCNACGKTYRSRTALSHHKALKHRN